MGRNVYLSDNDRKRLLALVGNWMVWLDDEKAEWGERMSAAEALEHIAQRRQAQRLIEKLEER